MKLKGSRKGSLTNNSSSTAVSFCTYTEDAASSATSQTTDDDDTMRGMNLRSGPRPANSMEQDSFDSFDDMEDMLVMSANSLNLSPQTATGTTTSTGGGSPREADEAILAASKSIIVTNVELSVFDNVLTKRDFETMFREYDAAATFHYLRSFRRIRIDFESHITASVAKQKLDNTLIGNNIIHCYFIQVLSPCTDEEAFLHVPPLEKQFLISPPCSPPVGWEQPREGNPIVDYDLLAAMAQLSPGENHELHPSKEVTLLGKSISTPSIVVHVCEEQANNVGASKMMGTGGGIGGGGGAGRKIKQTPRPDRQSSLD